MSSTMLSASLLTVEAYDAFSLSPITVVARVPASQLTSASRVSSATASAVFASSNATCVPDRVFDYPFHRHSRLM
jgi:hypothetical protein